MLPNILPLKPYFREMIWGGRGLQEHFGKPLPPNKNIGESWEVSAYPGMESVIAAGPLSGQSLLTLVETYGRELLGDQVYNQYNGEFPLLIKLLDARQDLSVQVHPNDTYARSQNLGTFGKMEAWYVLRSNKGHIACGLKDGIDKPAFQHAIRSNQVEDTVKFYNAHSGDVVFIPPGTVHALCTGVMIYEVQQSSDLTFRIYDYNRPGPDGNPRELHTEQALDVIAFDKKNPEPTPWQNLPNATPAHTLLVESKHFRLERFNPSESETKHPPYPSFAAITLLEGHAEIAGAQESYPAQKGDTFLIPANCPFTITHRNNFQPEYLISSVP